MRTNLIALIAVAALASACTRSAAPPPPPSPVAARGESAAQDREVVRHAEMELEAARPAETARRVEQLAQRVGGRVDQANDREARRVTMVLRIPAASLDTVLGEIGGMGKVKDKQVSALDVTDQATDLDARLANLIVVRDRLRQHLQNAGAMADVIAIERELARVQTEIDVLEARRRELRSSIALSRVALDIHRPRVLGPLGIIVSGLATVIGKLFVIQ